MAGVGTLLIAASLGGAVVGCKKKEEDTKPQTEKTDKKHRPQGDRYADGQRLAAALRDWTKRWADTTDLPACDPLLGKDKAGLELCTTAATALTTMKAAAAKPEAEAVLLHDAAELAYATEAASEVLRNASMEKMQADHKAEPAPSGSGAHKPAPTPAPAFSSMGKPHPLSSSDRTAAFGKLGDKLHPGAEAAPEDPAMQVLQAYSRVNRAALRYLSQFLQFGALPSRNAAFTELEALSHRKETWPALGRTLREAAMAENDPTLQGKLKALAPKLSRRPPAPVAPDASAAPAPAPSGAPAPH